MSTESSPRARRAAARAALGTIQYPDTLPVSARRDDIAGALRDHQVVVVAGATGSGKTTQLPKIALELGRGVAGQIGCTQPRRLAATSVAARVAEELGCPLGSAVGYQIRFLGRHDPSTCVKFMTDGILLSEIRRDRLLSNYDTLIIDEAHERGLNIDFLLGYLKQILPRRPDLRVAVSSATLDVQRFSEFFDGAPVVEVEGRVWPVEVRYRPPADDVEDPDYAEMTRQAVREILRDEPEGDILAFFPGEADIRDAAEALDRAGLPSNVRLLPLYARLSREEQQRVFDPVRGGRKIVLATNVAETSLTIPGIRAVVDTGRARVRRASEKASVERLLVERISRASAEQRKGRCGRVGPGLCVRLYGEEDFLKRPDYTDPEIRRASLAGVILQMKSLGLGELEAFSFIDPPRPAMVADGYRTLAELGALDAERNLTPVGRNLAHLPLEPRFGRMLLAARAEGVLDEALVAVAFLSVQDPRERPREKQGEADAAHRRFLDPRSDFVGCLRLWRFYEEEIVGRNSKTQTRKACRAHFLNYLRMTEWRDIHRQLAELLNHEAQPPRLAEAASDAPPAPAGPPTRLNRPSPDAVKTAVAGPASALSPDLYERLHRALLAGLLGRLGQRTDDGDYRGSRGVRFQLWPGAGPVALRPRDTRPRGRPETAVDADGVERPVKRLAGPAWVICAELVETSRLFGRGVAEIDPAWVERAAGALAKKSHAQPHYDPRSGFVRALEKVTVHGLAIVENRRIHYGPVNPADARALFIRAALVEGRMRNPPPFLRTNLALIEDMEALGHKARRPMWRGADAVFAFYDARLPADIHNDRALRDLPQDIERNLRLTPQLLADHDTDGITPDRFPTALVWRGRRYPLSYRFDPQAPDDGVTVIVPAADLPSLPSERLDWLVPGLLGEKIGALLRAFPKALRKEFIPIPETVEAVLREAPSRDGEPTMTFYEWLGSALGRAGGRRVAADAPEWHPDELPAHLRMNIRVVDAAGRGLGQSRDLPALRARLAGAAGEMLAVLPVDRHERSGLTSWDFGPLPESVELTAAAGGAARAIAFPALVDEEATVAVRLCKTPEEAREKNRVGLRRLYELACVAPLARLARQLPLSRDATLSAAAAGYHPDDLRRDLLRLAIDAVWVGSADAPPPRDAAAFERRIESGRLEVARVAATAARDYDEALRAVNRLWPSLAADDRGRADAFADLRRQLTELLAAATLNHWATPEAVARFPAYVAAAAKRRERLEYQLPRDRERLASLTPYLARWREVADQAREWSYARRRALSVYRWLLEEWRIGLFAQEIGTAVPASAKRLDDAWRAATEGG